MDLIFFLDKFYQVLSEDGRINATHISLYMALTREWNKAGGDSQFPIDRETVMQAAKISARFTYNKCMNNLQEFGYINYHPSVNSFRRSTVQLNILS